MPIPTPSAAPLFEGQIRPPDVPEYVPQPISFPLGYDDPVYGDGSETGGFAPYWSQMAADIPTPNRTSWMIPGFSEDLTLYLCDSHGGTKTEAKFRTHAEFKGIFPIDPIRNYGFPGGAHMHSFWGAYTPSPISTTETLRSWIGDDDGSGAAGGRLNNTSYWMPSLLFDKDGKTYAITPGYTVIYYKGAPEFGITTHPAPIGLRYVSGVDMENPNRILDIVNQANADSGIPAQNNDRYAVQQGTMDTWWHKWTLNNATLGDRASRYLVNPDGSNPWADKPDVASGATTLQMQFTQPLCWDGVNPWSPRGYDHVMPMIWDNHKDRFIPPIGWYPLPKPEYNMSWSMTALEEFLGGPIWNFNPRLSSDAHLNVNHGMAGKGHSFHTDWLFGWDAQSLRNWETNAIGCGVLGGIPHELNDSVIAATEKLLTYSPFDPAPDGKVPQVDFNRGIQITEIPATRTSVTTAVMA